MKDEELDEIEKRAAAAADGPWTWDLDHDSTVESANGGAIASVAYHASLRAITRTGQEYSHADAAFIAHARADVPALVAEVRRLRDALSSAVKERGWAESRADEAVSEMIRLRSTEDAS